MLDGGPQGGRALELVGVDLVAERLDAVRADLQAQDADDAALDDRDRAGVAVDGPGVDLGRAADQVALGLGRAGTGPT